MARAEPGIVLELGPAAGARATFVLRALSTPEANALRRAAMQDVPSVALTDARVIENTCATNNQSLAFMVGQIPVNLPLPAGPFRRDAFRNVELRLEARATAPEGRLVTADDFEVYNRASGTFFTEAQRAQLFPAQHFRGERFPTPVAFLQGPSAESDGEVLSLTVTPSIGTGADNACFSPVCRCAYEMQVDAAAADAYLAEMLAQSDKAMVARGIDEHDRRVALEREAANFASLTRARFVARDERKNPVGFRFVVESATGRHPLEIAAHAAASLSARARDLLAMLGQFKAALPALEAGTTVSAAPRAELAFDRDHAVLRVREEGHTLGGLLQDACLRAAEANDAEAFLERSWMVGYRCPHPMVREVVFVFDRPGLSPAILLDKILAPALEAVDARFLALSRLLAAAAPRHPLQDLADSIAGFAPAPEPERPHGVVFNPRYTTRERYLAEQAAREESQAAHLQVLRDAEAQAVAREQEAAAARAAHEAAFTLLSPPGTDAPDATAAAAGAAGRGRTAAERRAHDRRIAAVLSQSGVESKEPEAEPSLW